MLGVALVIVTAAWTILAALVHGGSPRPYVGLLFAVATVFILGRALGPNRRIVYVAVVVVAVLVAVASRETLFSAMPSIGLLGYVNARASFFVQATIACLLLAVTTRGRVVRVASLATAGVFALVPILSRSYAAAAVVLSLPPLALVVLKTKGARAVVILCAAAVAATLLGAIVAGATYADPGRTGTPQAVIQAAISERRLVLWHEALVMMRIHPAFGVGPGRFDDQSPTARSDPDAAHVHNEFLEAGAEIGAVGFGLVLLLFAWGFSRLWISSGSPPTIALGAVALAALGIHSSIDYVLHFALIPVVAMALVGSVVTDDREEQREV